MIRMLYRLEICTILFVMNWGIDCWGSYFSTSLLPHEQRQISQRNIDGIWLLWTITAITFDSCTKTKIFELLLCRLIPWYPVFNHLTFPSPSTRRFQAYRNFFCKMWLFQCLILEKLACAIVSIFHRSGNIISSDKAALNSEEIKPVAIAIIELRLSEYISQSVSRSVSQQKIRNFKI